MKSGVPFQSRNIVDRIYIVELRGAFRSRFLDANVGLSRIELLLLSLQPLQLTFTPAGMVDLSLRHQFLHNHLLAVFSFIRCLFNRITGRILGKPSGGLGLIVVCEFVVIICCS